MALLKASLVFLFAAAVMMPAISTTPAHAWKKKCYHCYYTSYGKKICHNDCRCYRTH